jgi:hypothetical protein
LKIVFQLDNGDELITSPDRLQLAPAKDGKSIILIACNQPIAAFNGQLIQPSAETQPVSAQ